MVQGIHDIERKIFEARGLGPDGKVQDILAYTEMYWFF